MGEAVCLPFRILPGKLDAVRAFMSELEGPWFQAYEQSQARIGVLSEYWFIGQIESADYLIGFITYRDFKRAVEIFSASQEPFDVWFKERCQECTGIDFNNPPQLELPALVSEFPR
jgi:hypothetical protein